MGLSGRMLTSDGDRRRDADFYATPPEATRALLTQLRWRRDVPVWEPACGDGAICRVLRATGHEVVATDLHDRGYGTPGVDFLTATRPECPYLVTNPPFKLAEAFIARAMELPLLGFALLLKSQFWHARGRLKLWEARPPRLVLPLTWRPDFLFGERGGAPTMDCQWTVWGPGPSLFTHYRPLAKPQGE